MRKYFLPLIIIGAMLLQLTGCSAPTGTKTEKITKQIKPDQRYTIGNVLENGWEIEVPKAAFADSVELSMNILSDSSSKEYQRNEFGFVLPPVELKISGKENVRLLEPIRVRLQIPKDKLKGLTQEELFYGYFYNGKWEYYVPEQFDMEAGTVSFDIYHFSFLGFGRPSEKEQIKTFAETMAVNKYNRSKIAAELKKMTEKQLNDLFNSAGATEAARNQMTADVLSYLEDEFIETGGVAPIEALAQMANAASQGEAGRQAFQNKLLEYTAKGLMATLEKDPDKSMLTPANVGKLYNVVGNLSTAAGALSEGDKKAALQAVAEMLKGYHPAVALTDATLKFIGQQAQNAIDYFAETEIEKAYQIYAGKAEGKYGIPDGDFNLIWTFLGGGQREYEKKILGTYAKKYGYDSIDQLPEKMREKILDDARTALKNYFDARKVYEPEMKRLVLQEEAFITELKSAGLLSSYANRDYFGIDKRGSNFDIETRLGRLYSLREKMRGMISTDKLATISDKAIVSCISQWIYWNEKRDLSGFYMYMREMGYMADTKVQTPDSPKTTTTPKASEVSQPSEPASPPTTKDPKYAWVLVQTINEDAKADIEHTNKGGVYQASSSAAPGSYTYSHKYIGETDTYPDPDQKNGEGYAMKLDISVPPSVIQGGETVSLEFNLAFTEQNVSYFDGNGSCRADFNSTRFVNKAGKSFFEIYCSVKYSTKNVLSVSDTITAKAPTGNKEGDRVELRTGGPSGKIGTRYVYEWKSQ